jgi:flagellar biosynthesis protein FlhG
MIAHGRFGATPGRGPVSLAVASGKGGVGKTNVVVNVAVALARLRNRVAVVDADFGLGNVDVLLGLAPEAHLGHVLTGERALRDVLLDGPHGVHIVPAGSGLHELTALTARQWSRLATGLADLEAEMDFVLIDTGAGISANVIDVAGCVPRVLVVTSLEPTAVVDAYALIKVLWSARRDTEIGVLVNGAADAEEAEVVFTQLNVAAGTFLGRQLTSFGFVPDDPAVRGAVLGQSAVVDVAPAAPASRAFRQLAARIAALAPLGGPGLRLVPRPGAAPVPFATTEAPQCA